MRYGGWNMEAESVRGGRKSIRYTLATVSLAPERAMAGWRVAKPNLERRGGQWEAGDQRHHRAFRLD
jgi:hypothetical protein